MLASFLIRRSMIYLVISLNFILRLCHCPKCEQSISCTYEMYTVSCPVIIPYKVLYIQCITLYGIITESLSADLQDMRFNEYDGLPIGKIGIFPTLLWCGIENEFS